MSRLSFSDRRAHPEEPADSDDEPVTDQVPYPIDWVLLTGDRGLIAVGFLLLLWGLLEVRLVGTANGGFLVRMLASLIGGNLTLITVVIAINQLIISREFSSPGELKEDVRGAIEYRQEVSDIIDFTTSPVRTDSFLNFLVTILRDEAVSLRDEAARTSGLMRTDLESFTDTLIVQVEELKEILDDTSADRFETLLVVLNTNFTTDLHTGHRIQAVYGRSIPSEIESQFETVIEILEHIGVARQHMKTLYFQRTLTALSREILYTGIPALGLLVVTILVLSGDSGPTVSGTGLDGLVIVTSTVAFAPLAVFFAHVFSIATITHRTGAMLPFVVEE